MRPAIAFLLLLAASASPKDIPMAVVVRTQGKVLAGPGKDLRPTKSGDVISKDWRVKTESDGRVLLRMLRDKALADVKPSSVVELDARAGEAGTVQDVSVIAGAVAFQIPGSGAGDKGRTETTVATAKSAQFGMSSATNGSTRVDVMTGSVQVCNQMTGEHLALGPGQSVVSGYEGFGSVQKIAADSSLASMEASRPAAMPGGETVELAVPFVDPVTGKTATLVLAVKRTP